jgi:hypothetical protein
VRGGDLLGPGVVVVLQELDVPRRVVHVVDPPREAKRPRAAHEDVHPPVLRPLEQLVDPRTAADLLEALVAHPQDPELRLPLEALPDHGLVALLEDVQGHHFSRQQDQPEREQREALE